MQHRKIDEIAIKTIKIMVFDVNTLMIVIEIHHEATCSEKNWISEDRFWWANVRPLVGKYPPCGGQLSDSLVGKCPLTLNALLLEHDFIDLKLKQIITL